MKKAQITVYLTLVFTLILSVFLSAFEAARWNHLKMRVENAVQTAIHSAFGEYHRVLFERYGVLFIDTSYMSQGPDYHKLEARIGDYLEYNLCPEEEQSLLFARDWYDVSDYNVLLTNIRLATDDSGNVFKAQAVDYIQNYVGSEWIEEVSSWIGITKQYDISEDSFREAHENAQSEAEDEWKQNNMLEEEWTVAYGLPSLDFGQVYIKDLLIPSVVNDSIGISTKAINPLELLSYRIKIQGTGSLEESETEVLEELYFNEYILHKLGNYQDVKADCALDYQAEYILFGQAQDSVNLLRTLEALFWFRGAANLTMLLSDNETQELIKAVSQVGLLAKIPPKTIQAIINICWAAAESSNDVRELTEGNRVPLLKEPKDFSVGIGSLLSATWVINTEDFDSDNAELISLGYEDYLRIFLQLTIPEIKVYRCMDMMEADIRLTEGNENFRMDACADAVSMEIGISDGHGYFYSMERKYSYF